MVAKTKKKALKAMNAEDVDWTHLFVLSPSSDIGFFRSTRTLDLIYVSLNRR
jgi:hypothetical protein